MEILCKYGGFDIINGTTIYELVLFPWQAGWHHPEVRDVGCSGKCLLSHRCRKPMRATWPRGQCWNVLNIFKYDEVWYIWDHLSTHPQHIGVVPENWIKLVILAIFIGNMIKTLGILGVFPEFLPSSAEHGDWKAGTLTPRPPPYHTYI